MNSAHTEPRDSRVRKSPFTLPTHSFKSEAEHLRHLREKWEAWNQEVRKADTARRIKEKEGLLS
jgi:hypothetical protein